MFVAQNREDRPEEQCDNNVVHEATGEAYDEQPRDIESDENIQRVTLIAGYSHHRDGSRYNSGPSGWRISPIPWRMMLAEDHPEPGPSHSSSLQPAHSSQDFLKAEQFNKRQASSDHGPDQTSYKRFKSSPPHLDDIDRKISLAGE